MRRDHFSLRLSRLAKSWRCCVQVKRNKRHKTENIYPGRKRGVRWKLIVRRNLIARLNSQSEAFKSVRKKSATPSASWKKVPLCQPSFGSRARFVQRATWTAACFQASHQQRMKAFKRGESCIFFFITARFVCKPQSVCLPACLPCLHCWFCLVCGLFVASKCGMC